nr:endonuclease/exonuclease/phosphatase family protein [Ornithinimicrobium sp. F0845]
MAEIVALVRQYDVDALVLLEATARTGDQVAHGSLSDLLPHVSGQVREDAGGTLVLTAEPHVELPDPPAGTFTQVAVRVQGAGGDADWTLVAVHPAPPLLTTSDRWRDDLAALQAWVEGHREGRLVLAGDFNASQGHPAFRALSDGMVDAHREAGAGWVRTWPMGSPVPPFIQLDHVLARGFAVQDAGVADLTGSDHRAVWARLR